MTELVRIAGRILEMTKPTKEKTIVSISLKLILGFILVGISQNGNLLEQDALLHIVKIPSLAMALVSAGDMIVSLVSYLALGCLLVSAITEGKNYFKYARTSEKELKEIRTRVKLEQVCKEKASEVENAEYIGTTKKSSHIIIEGIEDKR